VGSGWPDQKDVLEATESDILAMEPEETAATERDAPRLKRAGTFGSGVGVDVTGGGADAGSEGGTSSTGVGTISETSGLRAMVALVLTPSEPEPPKLPARAGTADRDVASHCAGAVAVLASCLAWGC
jgi:hypothetical protein